ncbi:MAG: chorismate mutase [Planctomycetota bacterium]|jgi:chorismate mutase/prephenate dehydratase|nr:chorismate mutase [Planctomycetota bacterium]
MEETLAALRAEINTVNQQLTDLLVRRLNLAEQVADCKQQQQLPLLDAGRERQILNEMAQRAGAECAYETKMLFSELFELSRMRQRRRLLANTPLATKIDYALAATPPEFPKMATFIACQGVEGSYGQQACDRLFFKPNILYFNQFADVFNAVEKGMCSYGVLPIENSIAGSVTQVYDLMREHHFYIARSIKQRLDHALLARPHTTIADVREILSHEQGLRQCANFLTNFRSVKITAVENTAVAARLVAASERRDLAAISSARCAEIYGLTPLRTDLTVNNYTRFICITRHLEIYPGANRVSLMLTLPHRAGSLNRIIARFAALGLNLLKIESRPISGKDFEFMFYFDIEASAFEAPTRMLLGDLSVELPMCEFLGNYTEMA